MEFLMRFINRTARCFTLYRNNCLENLGINGYQHLYIIKICSEPGILQDKLVKEIYVHKSSVTRQLSLLEKNGFIRRESCPDDRRQMMVYPTEKAVDLYPLVMDVRKKWGERIMEDLTQEEQETLLRLMARVAGKAEKLLMEMEESERGQ